MWLSVDPLADKYPGNTPYMYCNGNPIMLIDPDGMSPIYDLDGNFLGTDNLGLTGYYYVMDKNNFTQGMSYYEAGNCAVMGYISSEVSTKIDKHYRGLVDRPDYNGFVTVLEGILWAKKYPNALQNPTPDNTLYVDVSKLDFGSLSTHIHGFKVYYYGEGKLKK